MSTADLLGERARLTPDAPALVEVETDLRLTYRELDRRAERCARLFATSLGIAKGDRVGILAHNRVEYLDAFFAAGKAGFILVTLGTRLTADELVHIVADSGLRALIFDDAARPVVDELRGRVDVETWIALDGTADGAAGDDDTLFFADLIDTVDLVAPWTPTPSRGEDTYGLLYTSGTTGRPKGVVIPQRMLIANARHTVSGWQLRSDDVTSIFTPLYHAGGLFAFLVPMVWIGGAVVLHREFDTAEIWRTVEREGVTVALGVPTIWKMLLECPAFQTVDTSGVRWLISGGAPLPNYISEAYRRRDIAFKQGFGMTEVGVNCFAMTTHDAGRKAGSIGQPMMFTEVRLADEDGQDVPTGVVGELLFRGPHVCKGYWNNPSATAAALDADGFFHTGDLARRDADGFFFIAGRSKDMIISGGVNIYPAEIEAALVQHPEVEDVAVVGVPDEKWGEIGVAFVLPRSGEIDPDQLRDFLGERLARYKLPRHFETLAELPRTAYGKVVKGELRDRYLAERAGRPEAAPAQSAPSGATP
ncbi:MAG: long-chain fatty acid--CoA ligase [Acidobacteriota bacterium]